MGKRALSGTKDKLDVGDNFYRDYNDAPSHFLKEIYYIVAQTVHAKPSFKYGTLSHAIISAIPLHLVEEYSPEEVDEIVLSNYRSLSQEKQITLAAKFRVMYSNFSNEANLRFF